MTQFWLLNLQFITYSFATLTFFAITWLFWDSHNSKRDETSLIRVYGFIILTIASLAGIFSNQNVIWEAIFKIGFLLGGTVILFGIKNEHINPIPEIKKKKLKSASPLFILLIPFINSIIFFISARFLWSLYKKGLVKEYYKWFLGWILIGVSQLALSFSVFQYSDNVLLEGLGKDYSFLWIVSHLSMLSASLVLSIWIWNYLRFRVRPQLFMAFVSISVLVSTTSAVFYSTALFSITERDFLNQLNTNVKTANLNINQLKETALTSANILVRSDAIRTSMQNSDLNEIFNIVDDYANEASSIDYILVADSSGTIITKTNDFNAVGEGSLSEDQMIINAIKNKESRVSIVEKEDLLANRLEIVATAPIIGKEGNAIGILQTGYVLDNAYTDRLKEQTGLEITLFSQTNRSATTLTISDGESRAENTTETNQEIIKKVFDDQRIYTGASNILNVPFYVSYTPLFNVNNEVIGMMSVGRPQKSLIDATKETVGLTFLMAIVISASSLIPAKLLSEYIDRNSKV